MTIAEYDHMDKERKKEILMQCCGSSAWVEKMMGMPPAEDLIDLFEDAEEKWYECKEEDWKQAFSHHPKIGDRVSPGLSASEQSSVSAAPEQVLKALNDANKAYEQKFGYIFIVSASGKSAEEILSILKERLNNDPSKEIGIAMEEQNKITRLRLEKFFT